MEIPPLPWYYALLATASLFFFFSLWRRESETKLRLPPGPSAWPIVGNLFQLGKRPHETLHVMSLKYGPLMTLRLGMKSVVVVSSPAMAKEVLKTHDNIFAGRPVMETFRSLSHDKSSLVWGDYGPYWRNLRRISTVELFTPKRIEALQYLRRDQVFRTIRLIFEDKGRVVDIGRMAFCTSMNLLGNMIFSTDVCDPRGPDSAELKESIWELMKLLVMPNLADLFPFLAFLDPQGVSRRMAGYFKLLYDLSETFIQKRLKLNDSNKDFLDALLDSRSDDFDLVGIRALIAELFAAGTESSTTTIEWAMVEFIRNPEKLRRVRAELDEVVGCKRRVEECDVDRLPYLQAALKETFRLHPPAPMLLPHRAESSCVIGGFVIPKDTQVMVNAWAIGRDPAIWKNPSGFVPERFIEGENREIDYRGQDFELIPFGAGRRICPALPLASRVVAFVLASLLHSFEWKLSDGVSVEDMTDEFGVTFKQLNAIPVPRLPPNLY